MPGAMAGQSKRPLLLMLEATLIRRTGLMQLPLRLIAESPSVNNLPRTQTHAQNPGTCLWIKCLNWRGDRRELQLVAIECHRLIAGFEIVRILG